MGRQAEQMVPYQAPLGAPFLAIAIPIYGSLPALEPRNPQKVSIKKVFPGLPAWTVKKCRKSSKRPEKEKKESKSVFGDFFDTFFDTPGREARKDLFEIFGGFRGSKAWRLLYMGIAVVTLFLRMAVFQGIFKRENGPLRHLGKGPIKVGKWLTKDGKRSINANGQFSGTPPCPNNLLSLFFRNNLARQNKNFQKNE